MAKKLTKTKARQILHDKEVHGQPLTDKQRRFFGAIAGGAKPYKAQFGGIGGLLTGFHPNLKETASEVLSAPQKATTQLVTGKYQTPSEALDIQNRAGAFLTDVVLDPLGLLGIGAAKKMGALDNVYKINPLAEKLKDPNTFYRIADEASYQDFLNSGFVRSKSASGANSIVEIGESNPWGKGFEKLMMDRPTPFPSFSKGYPALEYLPAEGKGYIYSSKNPMFKRGEINPITGNRIKGRHWAYRPIDMTTGKVIQELPASNVKVFESKPHWLRGYKEVKPPKKKQDGGAVEGRMAGLTDKGFNFNPAWGGAWKNGGWLDKYADGGILQPPMAGAMQPALSQQFAMGGSLPGSVGFTYARTAGAAPSEGPYAKKTMPSAQKGKNVDANQEFLKDWYSKRKITDPYIQGALELDRPAYMKNLQTMPEYTMVESIDNDPNITGRYEADKNRLLLTRNAPEHVKTHELNHYLNTLGAGEYMRSIHKDIVGNELLPKSQMKGVYKDKYDYFSNPDEVHSRIMVLRQKAGFKPDETVTPEKLKGFIKTYKGDVDNINDLLNMSKGEEGLLNMLNFMAKGKSSTPTTAQNGAKVPVIEDEGSFNKDGVWIPDWEKMTAQAKKLGAKKVRTKHGSVIYFNDKWEVSSVDDNPDAKAQNGMEMKYYQEGLDWKPKTISKNGGWLDKFEEGGEIVKDNDGYWNPNNWGKPVEINSNQITMEGVLEPLLGVSDTGDTQMMYPGKNYTFEGTKVVEYPREYFRAEYGKSVNRADEYPLEKLDNLLNFTNYNKPKAKNGGWLDKYK